MPQYIYGPHQGNIYLCHSKYMTGESSQPPPKLEFQLRFPVISSSQQKVAVLHRHWASLTEGHSKRWWWCEKCSPALSALHHHIMKLMTHWCVFRFKSHSNITRKKLLLWMYRVSMCEHWQCKTQSACHCIRYKIWKQMACFYIVLSIAMTFRF